MAEFDAAIDRAERALAFARAAGASEAEATCTAARRFSAEARDRTLTKLEQSSGRSCTVRVFVDGAKATLATTDLTDEGLHAAIGRVVDAARRVAPDPLAGLPEPSRFEPVDLAIESADVLARTAEAKIEDALGLERVARAADERIVNSGGSRIGDTVVAVALANSRGLRGEYRATAASRMTSPIAADGERKRTASYGTAARGYAALEPVEQVAGIAARRAVQMCGARRPPTMRVPVIFERDVAAAVLSDIFASLSAANVAVGNSFLLDRVGDRIGSEAVTVIDDGRLRGGLGSAPFDAEGVPTRRTVVFDRGVLRSYLCDTYHGRRLGLASTANASPGGGVGANNLFLGPGTAKLADLIAQTKRGVFVLETIGFATENVTGTYSRGASGFFIENGELAYPIDEFTIAGNLATMLAGIDGVADDLVFDGSIVAPSFRVAEMTVSGS